MIQASARWLTAIIAGPKPLEASCWRGPDEPISDWVTGVADCDFLTEMMPPAQTGYLAVACFRERRSRNFNETIYLRVLSRSVLEFDWHGLRLGEDTWSGSKVNRLIDEFLGEALRSIDFAHGDLT